MRKLSFELYYSIKWWCVRGSEGVSVPDLNIVQQSLGRVQKVKYHPKRLSNCSLRRNKTFKSAPSSILPWRRPCLVDCKGKYKGSSPPWDARPLWAAQLRDLKSLTTTFDWSIWMQGVALHQKIHYAVIVRHTMTPNLLSFDSKHRRSRGRWLQRMSFVSFQSSRAFLSLPTLPSPFN